MSYRDDRAGLRAKVEELEQQVAELRAIVERLEVAAAAGPLRGISEDVADELERVLQRLARLEAGAGASPPAVTPSPAPGNRDVRRLVDAEMDHLTSRSRKR